MKRKPGDDSAQEEAEDESEGSVKSNMARTLFVDCFDSSNSSGSAGAIGLFGGHNSGN